MSLPAAEQNAGWVWRRVAANSCRMDAPDFRHARTLNRQLCAISSRSARPLTLRQALFQRSARRQSEPGDDKFFACATACSRCSTSRCCRTRVTYSLFAKPLARYSAEREAERSIGYPDASGASSEEHGDFLATLREISGSSIIRVWLCGRCNGWVADGILPEFG